MDQGFAKFVIGVCEVRLDLDNFPHDLEAGGGLLLGEQNETQMVLGLEVAGTQGQLTFKFLRRLVKLSGLEINQSRIVMNHRNFAIE